MTVFQKFIVCFLLFLICFVSKGQEKCTTMYEEVFFYLAPTSSKVKKKENYYYPLTLLIENRSKNSITIESFNKKIYHKEDYAKNKTFFWDFFTLSDEKPNDIVIITVFPSYPFETFVEKKQKKQKDANDFDIIIAPNTVFEIEILVMFSIYRGYPKGYYKLCLYYKNKDECVAEIIIKT